MKTCDLHTHTTASDGSDTPRALIEKAAEAGLSAVAVTDHDTTSGLEEARQAAKATDVEFIPGVELSVNFHKGNMHMLGYFMDENDPGFKAVLDRVQRARAERNPKILALLESIGKPISMEELEELAQGGQIGRPHIARAMVEKGYVKSVSQAFDKYLKRGAKAYAPKSILSPKEAIEVIRGARGVPVLAHPFSLLTTSQEELEAIVSELKDSGLMGLECYYSEHDDAFTSMCLGLAKKYELVVTGGSDYHGKAKPHIKLGRGKGNLTIPYTCVESLEAARANV
ncbi:MAG: PHP domain-containing protein [Thermodesulfobacteria bacterium]|nr:PHP domain-containing protein [Thermodesulfobacteriota bacterium]